MRNKLVSGAFDASSLSPAGRLLSLDALRGFAMFWIIGSAEMAAIPESIGIPALKTALRYIDHAAWHGFGFYDLIFPLFIFIVGVSLVFSLRKRLATSESRRAVFRHVLMRAFLLFLLGIFRGGGVERSPFLAQLPLTGVLQRIALCYFFAGIFVLTTGIKTQAIATTGLLCGYWLLMRFVPVPGVGTGVWTPEGNLAAFVDAMLLPAGSVGSPEGLLSTIPAVATCMMGVLAGHWLRGRCGPGGIEQSGARKAGILLLAGIIGILLGLLTSRIFPINKKLWTSSFVLLTGGLSAVMLGGAYWLIDVRGYRKWVFPFVVIGMNAIAIYIAVKIVTFAEITRRLVGGDIAAVFGPYRVLFLAVAQITLEWLVLYWLYRRKIFLRV